MFALPQPSISDFLQIYRAGIRGEKDRFADVREGSSYEHPGGIAAILFSREVMFDEDAFDACYFATADGDDLTDLVWRRFQKARVLDTPGQGTAQFVRASGVGSVNIPRGTRILIGDTSGLTEPVYYEVTATITVPNGSTAYSVPIQASFPGPLSALSTTLNDGHPPVLVDTVGSGFYVQSLTCGPGTTFEPAPDFRARVRQERRDARVGYPLAIVKACAAVGATHTYLFASDFGGDANDVGLNVAYVTDDSFHTPPALITACTLALESVRILGDQLQVLPVTTSALIVTATITLHDQPAHYNIDRLRTRLTNALTLYLTQSFSYARDELAGAMIAASADIQDVSFVAPTSDIAILQDTGGGLLGFPATLTRYTLDPNDVTLTFIGPT